MFWAGVVTLGLVSLWSILYGLREFYRHTVYGPGYFGIGLLGAWLTWVMTHEILNDENDETHFDEDDDSRDGDRD